MIDPGSYIVKVGNIESGAFEIQVTPLSNAAADRAEAQTSRTHPDIFTTEEAWRYLKMPCRNSFNRVCREHGLHGKRVGREHIYSREQLEAVRMKMFGMDLPKSRK